MWQVVNPEKFRNNICEKLNKTIKNEKISLNVEKGIFNYSIKHATIISIVKKWENSYFVLIYMNKLKSIMTNLNNNKKLLRKLKTKKFKAHKIAFMTHQEMCPEKWKQMIEDKKIKDKNRYTPKVEASTDNFTCGKCKSKKCTYYQLQNV